MHFDVPYRRTWRAPPSPAHRRAREPMNITHSNRVCITAAATQTASVKRERAKIELLTESKIENRLGGPVLYKSRAAATSGYTGRGRAMEMSCAH